MNEAQILIGELRAKGWTIAALADELRVHRETVSRWHSGSSQPDLMGPVVVALKALLVRRRIPKKRRYTKTPPAPES